MVQCPNLFETAAKSPISTGIPIVLTLLFSIVLLILSSTQATASDTDITIGLSRVDLQQYCDTDFLDYLQPFTFTFEGNDDLHSCPWRLRNTVFRLVIVCFSILTSIGALVVLCFKPNQKIWTGLYWFYWILFAFYFILFVLDCDGVNTGFQTCLDEFSFDYIDIGGSESTFQLLLNVSDCYITPWIYTVLADLILVVTCYIVYRISRYYIVDPVERRASYAGKSKSNTNSNTNTSSWGSNKNKSNSSAITDTTSPSNGTGGKTDTITSNQQNKKDDSPDPFAGYKGNYEDNNDNNNIGNDNAYGDNTGGDAGGGGGGVYGGFATSVYDE